MNCLSFDKKVRQNLIGRIQSLMIYPFFIPKYLRFGKVNKVFFNLLIRHFHMMKCNVLNMGSAINNKYYDI